MKDYSSSENKIDASNVFALNSTDYISNFGLKNNFSISLKNLNSIGKKTSQYKSNAQMEIASLFN